MTPADNIPPRRFSLCLGGFSEASGLLQGQESLLGLCRPNTAWKWGVNNASWSWLINVTAFLLLLLIAGPERGTRPDSPAQESHELHPLVAVKTPVAQERWGGHPSREGWVGGSGRIALTLVPPEAGKQVGYYQKGCALDTCNHPTPRAAISIALSQPLVGHFWGGP